MAESFSKVCINLGSDMYGKPLEYNVSGFLRSYKSIGEKWNKAFDNFVQNLDKKVTIDVKNETHNPVLKAIDAFIDAICDGFNKLHLLKGKVVATKSGSLFAGLRTGRPYEADVLLIFHKEDIPSFFFDLDQIVKAGITEEWIIHGNEFHNAGVCLSLEYSPTATQSTGVLLDLIPCVREERQIEPIEFNEHLNSYLKSLRKRLDLSRNYLVSKTLRSPANKDDFNTGYLEHQVLENLDDNIKCIYRVAKYLLQSQLVLPALFVNDEHNRRTEQKRTDLYGYKSMIKSHILQVFMLQLLLHTHDTPLATQLTGGALTICLLDILYKIVEYESERDAFRVLDPMIKDRNKAYSITNHLQDQHEEDPLWCFCIRPALDVVACGLMKHAAIGTTALSHYQLMSHPNDVLDRIAQSVEIGKNNINERSKVKPVIEKNFQTHYPQVFKLKFTGFCQGPKPDQMIEAYDCKTSCKIADTASAFSPTA